MKISEAIKWIDDRMCFGRGQWTEHHQPIIDEVWQAGRMAIEALQNSQWIPCNVRLPEQDGCYLVTAIKYGDELGEVDEANYINGKWYTVDGEVYHDQYKGYYITAWMLEPEPFRGEVQYLESERIIYESDAVEVLSMLPSAQTDFTTINKLIDHFEEILAYIRESHGDDSVCGWCEFDGAYIGESGDWCNECPGFNRDDCFKLRDKIREKWITEITNTVSSTQPERKKGEWVWDENGMDWGIGAWKCNRCHHKAETWWANDKKYNPLRCSGGRFCGVCGADMRSVE